MYQIYAGNKILYSAGGIDERYVALSPTLKNEINKAANLSFTLIPNNQCYDEVKRLTTPITVYKDGKVKFYGRVLETTTDFYKNKSVVCEGALAFFNDVIIRPFEFTDSSVNCVRNYIDYFLGLYNAGVEDWKKIQRGAVTVTDSNNYLRREKDSYNTAYSVLVDHTINSTLGGYLSIRRENGVTYLDYTKESGGQSNQRIMYGRNLLNLTEKASSDDVFTIIIPIGKDGLTIEDVNGGLDFLESAEGIANFGRVWATRKYDDITTAEGLKNRALADLAVGIKGVVSIDLSAVDLSVLGIEADEIECGEYIPVFSAPHGIDAYIVCNTTNIVIDDPTASTYSVGAKVAKLTDLIKK